MDTDPSYYSEDDVGADMDLPQIIFGMVGPVIVCGIALIVIAAFIIWSKHPDICTRKRESKAESESESSSNRNSRVVVVNSTDHLAKL